MHQLLLAEQGHLPAMVAMAELYYWGQRGFARDHARARALWSAAAARGHVGAQCAAAGMWLRAEGGDANHSRAVELYEAAAAAGSSRALNGLGYEYFFGHVLDKDEAKACVSETPS